MKQKNISAEKASARLDPARWAGAYRAEGSALAAFRRRRRPAPPDRQPLGRTLDIGSCHWRYGSGLSESFLGAASARAARKIRRQVRWNRLIQIINLTRPMLRNPDPPCQVPAFQFLVQEIGNGVRGMHPGRCRDSSVAPPDPGAFAFPPASGEENVGSPFPRRSLCRDRLRSSTTIRVISAPKTIARASDSAVRSRSDGTETIFPIA